MKKKFLKELILPSFWLFFFIVYSKNEKKIGIKNAYKAESRRDDISASDKTGKIKETTFTKAVYLAGF